MLNDDTDSSMDESEELSSDSFEDSEEEIQSILNAHDNYIDDGDYVKAAAELDKFYDLDSYEYESYIEESGIPSHSSPLHFAVRCNDQEGVEHLLNSDQNPNVESGEYYNRGVAEIPECTTALIYAVSCQNVSAEIIFLLMGHSKVDLDVDDVEGNGVVYYTLIRYLNKNTDENLAILEKLLLTGYFDLNTIIIEKQHFFYYLVKNKQVKLVSFFVNYVKKRERQAAELSLEGKTTQATHILTRLCLRTGYCDENGYTALHLACMYNSLDLVKILMSIGGVDLNAEDINGKTPLWYVSSPEIMRVMRRKPGVFSNHKVSKSGEKKLQRGLVEMVKEEFDYPEYIASALMCDVSGTPVAELINDGNCSGNEDEDEDEGKSLLHSVAEFSSDNQLKEFLKFPHVDLKVKDPKGKEASDIATSKKRKRLISSAYKNQRLEGKYTTPGESSDDSDDEFAPTGSLFPIQSKLSNSVNASSPFYIAKYRGVTHRNPLINQTYRRKVRKLSKDNTPSQSLHSAASYELARIKMLDLDAKKGKLQEASRKIKKTVLPLRNKKAEHRSGTRKKYPHTTILDEIAHHYITSYKAYLKNQEAIVRGHVDSIKKEKIKEMEEKFGTFNFTKLHFVSTADIAKSALGFGFGENIDFEQSEKLLRIRRNGKVKHYYLGMIYLSLFTPEELQSETVLHVPTLQKQKRVSPGLIFEKARETIFIGNIPSHNIINRYMLRIPNFEEYKTLYLRKYGIDEGEFLEFKKRIYKHYEDKVEFKKVISDIIKKIIVHAASELEKIATNEVHRRGGKLVYEDFCGGYVESMPSLKQLVCDESLIKEISKLSLSREKNKVYLNSRDATFKAKKTPLILSEKEVRDYCQKRAVGNLLAIEGDGNCFFRAVLSALGKNSEYHMELRSAAIQYIKDHRAVFNLEGDAQLDEHIEKMSHSGEWAEDHIIAAAGLLLDCQINIIQLEKNENDNSINQHQFTAVEMLDSSCIVTLFRVNNNHYHALQPSNRIAGSQLASQGSSSHSSFQGAELATSSAEVQESEDNDMRIRKH